MDTNYFDNAVTISSKKKLTTLEKNKRLQQHALLSGAYKEYREIQRTLRNFERSNKVPFEYEDLGLIYLDWPNLEIEQQYNQLQNDLKLSFQQKYGSTILKNSERIDNNRYARVSRIRKKYKFMIESGQASFVTLTFRDDVLNSTNEITRRKYITNYLKKYSDHYVANIDYGKTTEREHYHAITYDTLPNGSWPYGFMNIQHITNDEKSKIATFKYLATLTNHALKHTTKNQRLIYSREKGA